MKNAADAMSKVDRIRKLSSHLQDDLLQITGKAFSNTPRFSMKLLLPVGLVVGTGLLLAFSPKTRNSLLVRTGVLLATRYLRDLHDRELRQLEAEEARHEDSKA